MATHKAPARSLRGAFKLTLLVLACAACFVSGGLAHRQRWAPFPQLAALYKRTFPPAVSDEIDGRFWHRKPGSSDAQIAPGLMAVPYVQGYTPASSASGVTRYERQRAAPGLNLYLSTHAPEARLIDMEGATLHTWRRDFRQVWPNAVVGRENAGHQRFWRRARLFENGELLAIFEGLGLIKVDRDSKLLWSWDGGAHHDLSVTEAGTIFTLGREWGPVRGLDLPRLEDFVAELSSEGKLLRRFSVRSAFASSEYYSFLERLSAAEDPFHTNAVRWLDGSLAAGAPALRRGNLLLSIRELDALAIVDPDAQKVVWAVTGPWHRQHAPVLLARDRLLLFDNNKDGAEKRSRILELDPFSLLIRWRYEGSEEAPFYSRYMGFLQALENGDVLVTDSMQGRAFEVDREGRIVWEFVNPARAGERQDLVADLLQMERLRGPLPWLEGEPRGR